MTYRHIPVMMKEVLEVLNCTPGKIFADGTLGGAGHATAIIERILPGGLLIGTDQDTASIRNAGNVLKPYADSVRLIHGNYLHLDEYLSELNIVSLDGILLDLGVSLYQLESGGRGFSFKRDEPLDMRMNTESEITAEYLVNTESEEGLAKLFREYGEERRANAIARRIAAKRKNRRISSSLQLAGIVCEAAGDWNQKIHPATRVFMALRIAVNRELENIEKFMKIVPDLLSPGGRLCVLSFHSLEDRIVKHAMRAFAKGCTCPPKLPRCICNGRKVFRLLTKKALRPSPEEIRLNPMSRSTKLRAVEKI